MASLSRRQLLATAVALLPARLTHAAASARVVVVGGGFAGASCARWLKRLAPPLSVILVEADRRFLACPGSNGVLAGLHGIEQQQFGYDLIARAGVDVLFGRADAIDGERREVRLADGGRLPYDRLVLAPGIDFRWDALPGYDQPAAEIMPHAWKAGAQTLLLRQQLLAIEDGGLVVIAVPANPYRCPPGPYERASLIAHYLSRAKPRSKVMILDAKDSFSKQKLFQQGWEALYPGKIEWVPLSQGGRLASVDPSSLTLVTDFDRVTAAVANVIPPQRAGAIASLAGVADRSGWCPVDPDSFESALRPLIHVIGDAALAGAMPKSAFAANAQAKLCAAAVISLLAGEAVSPALLVNTCYSLVAPDYGISIAGVYRAEQGVLTDIPGAGGASPLDAPAGLRQEEARLADGWFTTITTEVFG